MKCSHIGKKDRVCFKAHATHVHMQSRSSGVFLMKRVRCIGSKCYVFKQGVCVDIGLGVLPDGRTQARSHWWTNYANDNIKNMKSEAMMWARAVEIILETNNNKIPKKYLCSNRRNCCHSGRHHHKDLKEARHAIMIF